MGGFLISQTMVLSGEFSEYITLETLFGVVVALAVLILIMVITYFVNIKPNLKDTSGKPLESITSNTVFEKIVQQEEEELVNDYELVAVITAAIYASMGDAIPADGFVVRSIRKANSKRLINA